jgi:myo-inositol-1(or 4)-monophosphatase
MTDADAAIAAVQAGAAIVRRLFGRSLERIDKGAGDFATTADVQAEYAMSAILRHAYPRDSIVGEETGPSAGDSGRRWLLDPLCGTLNYAARMPVVAVNASLHDGVRFLAAAVANPFGDEVLWTDMSSAFMRSADGDTPLFPNSGSRLVDVNLDPPFPNAGTFRAVYLLADPRFIRSFRPRVVSTSMALAWVATGQRAAYVSDGDPRDSVHFGAGIALCRAAGCVVTDLDGFSWDRRAGGLLVAADAATHSTLLGIVKSQRSRWLRSGA